MVRRGSFIAPFAERCGLAGRRGQTSDRGCQSAEQHIPPRHGPRTVIPGETLIRISNGLSGFDGRAQLKTWAFSIATRVAADYLRQPAHRLSVVDISETPEPPSSDRPIDDGVLIDEMNACVRQVIDSLPEDYRAALVLHDLEGMSGQETAEVSGCSLPTAKIRIHRARARLEEALKRECEFYRDEENVFRCDRKN